MKAVFAPGDLDSLRTTELMGLRAQLLRCGESLETSDLQTPADFAKLDPDGIYFKNDPRWAPLYADVKRILGTREHLPSRAKRAVAKRGRESASVALSRISVERW
jgi:hypothetical protein